MGNCILLITSREKKGGGKKGRREGKKGEGGPGGERAEKKRTEGGKECSQKDWPWDIRKSLSATERWGIRENQSGRKADLLSAATAASIRNWIYTYMRTYMHTQGQFMLKLMGGRKGFGCTKGYAFQG